MHVFVLWSGGLDSTYLIQKYLSEGHRVTAGYVEIINNEEKTERELNAIEKMITQPTLNVKDFYYQGIISRVSHDFSKSVMGLLLVPPFISALSQNTLDINNVRFDQMLMGYVVADDAISFLDDIQNVWSSLDALTLRRHSLPELVFPISKYHKTYIYTELNSDLKDHITWCESEKNIDKPCGKCDPCGKMIRYGHQSKLEYFENEVLTEKFAPEKGGRSLSTRIRSFLGLGLE